MIRIAITDIPPTAATRRAAECAAVADALNALVPGAVLVHGIDGGPYVMDRPDLTVSVSHSRTHAVVAVSDNGEPIGIDIETNRTAQLAKVASRFLDDAERTAANGMPRGMLMAWTAKEATFKADRGRHAMALSDIRLAPPVFARAVLAGGDVVFNIDYYALDDDTLIAVATKPGKHNITQFIALYEREDVPRRIDNMSMLCTKKHKTVNTTPRKLVFATNNTHKLSEMRRIVGDRFEILSLADIGCRDDIPEDADTLEGNAVGKARWVVDRYGYDCFADDTGLEVDALGGAPGVHSARYAPGEGHDAAANTALLLKNLAGVEAADRTAHFRTVIALILDGGLKVFEGRVDGFITDAPAGNGGFGYDPVFRPEGFDKTFAEISADEKNAVSHRGRATRRLIEFLDNISE